VHAKNTGISKGVKTITLFLSFRLTCPRCLGIRLTKNVVERLAHSLSIIESDPKSLHHEQNPKGDRNNARVAKQTQVNGDRVTVLLEHTAGGGDEPDVSAGGLFFIFNTQNS